MKNISVIGAVFLAAFLVNGCGKDRFSIAIDAELPPFEKQLVAHCYINSDGSGIIARLSETKALLGGEQELSVVVGEMSLYQNGIELFDFGQIGSNSTYQSWEINLEAIGLNEGEIELRAAAPGYPDIRATQTFPTLVPITDVAFQKKNYRNSDGQLIDKLSITFNDPPDEENFYEIGLSSVDFHCGGTNRSFNALETNDISTDIGAVSGIITLSDKTFDGQSYTLILGANEVRSNGHNLQISWKCITKEQYQYSRSLHEFSSQEELGRFGDPVSVFSNIENGVGIFACASNKTYLLQELINLKPNKVIASFLDDSPFDACRIRASLIAGSNVSLLARDEDREFSIRIENPSIGISMGTIFYSKRTSNEVQLYRIQDTPITITAFDEASNILSGTYNGTLFGANSTDSIEVDLIDFHVNYQE